MSQCFKCGKAITQVPYKYDGMTFHARCLHCSTCDKKLAGKPFIVASKGIFCGEQCKLSFAEQLTKPSTNEHAKEGTISPELITDFEALQSIVQLPQRRSSSPLPFLERVTDYPVSNSMRLSQSPTPQHRPASISPVPDSYYSSNSTLNRSDSLSAISQTSGTSDTSKPPQKRILKKSNGPRRPSTNHVRWNLDSVEHSTDDGDNTSMESTEAGGSGDPYKQIKEKYQKSKSTWKDFENPPIAGSTGLTPASSQGHQKAVFHHPEGFPLSPIHGKSPVRFPGYYELSPQTAVEMKSSHSTPLRSADSKELYGDDESSTRLSESAAAGFSVLRINDSSLASLEVTGTEERTGKLMFEFPQETPRRAPLMTASASVPACSAPTNTLTTPTSGNRETVGGMDVPKDPPVVERSVVSDTSAGVIRGAGVTGVVSSSETIAHVVGSAQILHLPRTNNDDDDALDYDHLEEKKPSNASNGALSPLSTKPPSVPSVDPDSLSLGSLKAPNGLSETSNGPPSAPSSVPPNSVGTNVSKTSTAQPEPSKEDSVGYRKSDIEEAIEMLEHEMNSMGVVGADPPVSTVPPPVIATSVAPPTPPLAAAAPVVIGTVPVTSSTIGQGFHNASEVIKVWSSTFSETLSGQTALQKHKVSDIAPSAVTQHELHPSPPPPPLPIKNSRISRSERDDEGNPLVSMAGKEAIQLSHLPDIMGAEIVHLNNLPPVIETSSLTPPEGDTREVILPPPSEFLGIPPQFQDNDDDYFDFLEQPNANNPLKVPGNVPSVLGPSASRVENSPTLAHAGPLHNGLVSVAGHHPVQRVQSSRVASTASKMNELSAGGSNSKLTVTRPLHVSNSESSLNNALHTAKVKHNSVPTVPQFPKPPLLHPVQVTNRPKHLPNQTEEVPQIERVFRRTSSQQVPMQAAAVRTAYPVPLLNNKFNPTRYHSQTNVAGSGSMITDVERDCKMNLQETRVQPVCAACGKPIVNFPINHEKCSYHSKCYHCAQCGCSLVDKAICRTRNGLICKEHLAVPGISSSTTPSQARRTTDHQSGYPGHTHYHQSLSGGNVTTV